MVEAAIGETGERTMSQNQSQTATGVASPTTTATSMMGDAASAIFLLRDYSKFGLAERICYHFDLTETLVANETSSSNVTGDSDEDPGPTTAAQQNDANDGSRIPTIRACGVLRLLEFAPTALWQRFTRRQKKSLRSKLRLFNHNADQVHSEGKTLCYQPQELPLRCNPSTRIYFGYEVTRIAFCVDASASLTSTFGVMGRTGSRKTNPMCPLDRLPSMARVFFQALTEPVTTAAMLEPWKPRLSVTVVAVYPMGDTSETSLLVRDYHVYDSKSAKRLVDEIEKWTYTEVESGISERLARRNASNAWSVPIYSSNMKHILEAGDYALDILSSEARPVIVVATDGRSISCEGIVDVVLDVDRVDIPVHILDLSMSESHIIEEPIGEEVDPVEQLKPEMNFLLYDPGGTMDFPAHLTDDSEALFLVSRATGGCFLDTHLLIEATKNTAGQQFLSDDPLQQSHSFKRRFARMNGLQWLVLFSLSPITPTFHSSWGKLVPPAYLQKQLSKSALDATAPGLSSTIPSETLEVSRHQNTWNEQPTRKHQHTSKTTFSIYVVSPVRVKALILMRIKEGYRAKQYGLSSNDPDKVFIQFTLPMEFGTILHYELSYKALSSDDHMVGSAHIKIELSGDPGFVQFVKHDFLRYSMQVPDNRAVTIRSKKSSRLCHVIRSTRSNDILQSFLKPPQKWSDQLISPDAPFAKRLGSLTRTQKKNYFQADKFDVVCTGLVPYGLEDNFLSQFVSNEDGAQELLDAITLWSTLSVKGGTTFVKRISTFGKSTNYCVVELEESEIASNLYTVSIEFLGGTDPQDRLRVVSSLKDAVYNLKNAEVLHKQMAPFLAGRSHQQAVKKRHVEIQFHHATWDLVMDPELLSLLTKRRVEIGNFRLLESKDDYALFAKLVPTGSIDASPDDLVQYQIAVLDDKVVVDLHMESESGVFNPYQDSTETTGRFEKMVNTIRRRDQECGRALRSRTNLLRIFQSAPPSGDYEEDHRASVNRILAYSSRVTRKLRFFNSTGGANDILTNLTADLLLSISFDVASEKLSIGSDEIMGEEEPGLWFIQQYDRQTMSIVHLSLVDEKVEGIRNAQNFRALTFFTNGISDLYSKRDDLADDDSTESHISEYLCVTEFADQFEVDQKKNFALAAYLGLRQAKNPEDANICEEDIEFAMESVDFVEVSSVLVGGTTSQFAGNDSKLLQSIGTILQPVPGQSELFFYSGDSYDRKLVDFGDHESVSSSDGSSDEIDSREQENFGLFDDDDEGALDGDVGTSQHEDTLPQPIFVKFQIDDSPISIADLGRIARSGLLRTSVSVFKSNKGFPSKDRNPSWSHRAFASEITAILRSYVAEQTLARLQGADDLQSQDSLQIVMKSLSRIQSVVSFSVEIYFFISQRGIMMPAGAPAGAEAAVAEGFSILDSELTKCAELGLTRLPGSMYFVSSIQENSGDPLQFWCMLSLQNASGNIAVQVYHPDGHDLALTVLQKLHTILCSCIHLTNQRLLLQSLHRTRMASELLIPKQVVSSQKALSPIQVDGNLNFQPGVFGCSVVFRTTFDLYQRAATNPAQVARTLEATVLHNFAVSNRSGIFVYKDESDAIFYMKIQPRGSGIDSEGQVELLVFGLGDPGPSVTNQLRTLLQRRLLLIAVDMLSNVLTKNPHFKWKRGDLAFLRSFEKEWKELENVPADGSGQFRYYRLPKMIHDPCMVLLYLRQNLCGSTFFHRLNDMDQAGHNPSPPITSAWTGDTTADGVTLKMNQHEFSLYYNYAPSKLEPSFQGLSTLTPKGAEYCRQTGTGIAVIEFTLIKGNGQPVDDVRFAQHASGSFGMEQLPVDLRLSALPSFPIEGDTESLCARVKVTDTALNRNALHEWICLSLNQAVVGWVAERWLERSFFWLHTSPLGLVQEGFFESDVEFKRGLLIDRLCPSLPALKTLLETSFTLPHPAITRFESAGTTKSSSVASMTLSLLQQHILSPLLEKKLLSASIGNARKRSLLDQLLNRVKIVRLSRFERPVSVHIRWSEGRNASVTEHFGEREVRVISDSPVDCPEYLCFFSLSERDETIFNIESQLRLYREVVIHDGISEKSASIDLLESIKGTRPNAFFRSFSFILSVKRNTRRLWTYNWNPDIAKSVSASLREADAGAIADTARVSSSLQRRSLGLLSAEALGGVDGKMQKEASSQRANAVKPNESPSPANESIEKPHDSTGIPTRRIRRPTTIRRPKLIGKSVEGAAMQAVAASRKRASSNQFRNIPSQAIKQGGRATSRKDALQAGRGKPGTPTTTPSDHQLIRPVRNSNVKGDDKAARVKIDYLKICALKQLQLRRTGSLQRYAGLHLMNVWWPRSPSHNIPPSVLEILQSTAPKGWQDICSLPPLPGRVTNIFIPTFARWIAALTPGLELVRTIDGPNEYAERNSGSVYLCSTTRNVHGTKCCAIVRLSLIDTSRRRAPTVRAEGWMLNLPRRSAAAQRRKGDIHLKSASNLGRDSVGMDVLMAEAHMSVGLERLLFDFSCSMVERAVRMLDSRINFEDLVPTVKELMKRYPYERQKRIPQLNYRAFEGTIVLKSYEDRFIDMFGARALFRRLIMESSHRDMLDCKNALCFKKTISVKGSHSICFLTADPSDDSKMQLVVLCRTQGVNLADFMFREGSNVAIHILDNIAVEGAGLALRELRHAAKSLLRDKLWNELLAKPLPPKKGLSLQASPWAQPFSPGKYYEMLSLAHVQSLLDLPVTNNPAKGSTMVSSDIHFLFSAESGLDWRSICSTMNHSKVFTSSLSFVEEGGTVVNLFYLQSHDVFLKLDLGSHGQLLGADVIAKSLDATKSNIIFESIVNYLLHYVWHAL